jgi:hypothetical protein
MAHWVFVPYVIGASDTGAIRNYDEQTVKKTNDADIYDNNGKYIYKGDVYVIWQGNSKRQVQLPPGYYPDSSATVTINRHYINTETIVGISEFDKLVPIVEGDPLEYASVQWEQLKTNNGLFDRAMYKIVQVDHLSDANGVDYNQGSDFTIEDGNIKWLSGGNRPGIDNNSGEGVIMALRYRYVPSFYVKHAAHELRSHPTIDPVTGDKRMIRGPMQASIQVDWVFNQALKNQEQSGDTTVNAGTGGNIGSR